MCLQAIHLSCVLLTLPLSINGLLSPSSVKPLRSSRTNKYWRTSIHAKDYEETTPLNSLFSARLGVHKGSFLSSHHGHLRNSNLSSVFGAPTSFQSRQHSDQSLSSTALHSRGRRGLRRKRRRRPRHRYDDDDGDDIEDSCNFEFKEELDHLGLAKSIDAEYAIEEAKLDLSFWDVLKREQKRPPEQISEKSKDMSPLDRTFRRMTYREGNVENKYNLMSPRNYGNPSLLDKDHVNTPPSLDDLNQAPEEFKNTYWSQPIFRFGIVVLSYFSFPYWCKLLSNFQTVDSEDFNTVVGQIAPNVGVLYATILALTLQVLYQRFTRIQENATTEAMLLSQITRNLLALFDDEPDWAFEACQMVANQIRIMVSRTRGVELLSIMKADTYSNLLALVDDYHYLRGCDENFTAQKESVTSMLRSELTEIMSCRALRLSDEASSLPPTHFLLVTSLSVVSIIAYVTASLAVIDDLSAPPQEASLLFSGLAALYILFFNFCKDLNGPFQGVYQIKRSNAVSHLLQTKWLIVSEFGEEISFGVNYDESPGEMEKEEKTEPSLLDKLYQLTWGKSEEIDTVETGMMTNLVEELEKIDETSKSEAAQTLVGKSEERSDDISNEQTQRGNSLESPELVVTQINKNEPETTGLSSAGSTGSVEETIDGIQIDDLCDIAQPTMLSLDCEEETELVAAARVATDLEQVTAAQVGQMKKVSKKIDPANYFRRAGGFAA